MIFDFDPRINRENLNAKSYPRRLLEDILTSKIVDSMSFGTASNYNTRSYGPNHRILYEGVARLLSEVLVGSVDNLEDVEFSQLRAEFVSTRLMYLIFPDEKSVPVGDSHEETISFLLQTYEALLQGATKKSIDEVLNDISEGNAVVASDIEGYVSNIKSSILATTEFNTDGVYTKHRHFAFTDEKGLGSTNKPLEYKWGDKLHTHEIIDGVIQPYVDSEGNSHTHQVYLGVPENIIRLQSNLRKVLGVTKPAHIKTGEVSSVIDEDIPILQQGKQDVFSPILGIDPTKNGRTIISENTTDPNLPYYNQNAQFGLVGLSVGSLYQEDMRKARDGVYESELYGYVSGNTIRVWRTNIELADTLVIENQKLRVISVSNRIVPLDGIYTSRVGDDGIAYTYKTIRDLKRGISPSKHISTGSIEVINGCIFPPDTGFPMFRGYLANTETLNDGEPVDFNGSVFYCDLMSDNFHSEFFGLPAPNLGGHTIRLSYIEIVVDTVVSSTGLQLVRNASSPWNTRDQILYETVEFINKPDPLWDVETPNPPYELAINLPSYIVKDMLKSNKGLPISAYDLEIKVNDIDVDYSNRTLALEHTNSVKGANTIKPHLHVMRIFDHSHSETLSGLARYGDKISLTYPKAKSELRRFRELNSIEMTLNAVRPARKVSESGRGIGQNRVIETTSPISYVLNEAQPVSPQIKDQKIATYSAGSSDLLNTENQNLNTTYTLNNFSLNQTATQDQVFKPATKTLNTSNPKISFYVLGFRPSFITSVVDSDGVSYLYSLNQDHLLVQNLVGEKTLTVSGISSNPFSSDLDWYKGEKLVEGQAFFRNSDQSDLANFRESSSENYMRNPLGLASNLLDTLPTVDPVYTYSNDVIVSVELHDRVAISDGEIHVDEIRSLYSMLDTKTSGVEGEMVFYEDVITEYELDGRDGFTDEYNPHIPLDDWLYPDPALYVLGPISQVSSGGNQVNTIPTFLFFGYEDLKDMGQDDPNETDYYFSIYRIDGQGVKQYQTLTVITDPNNFVALQESQNESNGSPLAYRFQNAGGGMPNSLNYNSNSNVAYANASFNHIENETYYLEVFYEEAPSGGSSYLAFFSKGSGNDVNLSDTFFNLSQDAENQNEVEFLTGLGIPVTVTYEVTFTTNPGEIATFSTTEDPNPQATKEVEVATTPTFETGVTITFRADDNYAQPVLKRSTSWKDIFYPYNPETNEGMFFFSTSSRVPKVTDFIDETNMSFAPVEVGSTITFGDSLSFSLLLLPALITESLPDITDDHYIKFNYDHVFLEDTISLPTSSLEWLLNLVAVSESDTVPSVADSIISPTYQRYVPSSTVPSMGDESKAFISSYFLNSSVSISDDLLFSFAYLPRSVSDTVGLINDGLDTILSLTPINESDTLPSLSDEAKAFISSYFLSDTVGSINDGLNTSLSITPINETDTVPNILDIITVPVYQTLTPNSVIGSITDSLNASIQLYKDLSDTVSSVSDGSTLSLSLSVSLSDAISSLTDLIEDIHQSITLPPTPPPGAKINPGEYGIITFNASATAFISSTTQTETIGVSVSDAVSTSLRFTTPSLMIAVKYGSFSDDDNELFSIYKGYMDTLEYPAITDLQPDSNGATAVQIVNGTPNSSPTDTNERTVSSIGPDAYNNTNADANIRVGPLEYDTDYKIYSYTEYDDTNLDISIAMKVGGSSSNSTAYLDSVGYTDLYPGTSTPNDKFYIHEFYIRSSDMAVIFTADTTGTVFAFASAQSVRLYMHFIYTYTNTLDSFDIFKLREARTGATHSSPNGTGNDSTGWIEPDLHATITGLSNFSQSGSYVYTHLPNNDVPNTDNDGQVSWMLNVGTRYHIQLFVRDQNPDFEIYLRPVINDNGVSWNTAFSSSDSLTYTELLNQNDNSRVRTDHFFTIRRDGFIIWEQDPQT